MAKPNTYVLLKNAQQQIRLLHAEVERMKGFTLQQSLDMALITLNTEFGFGPERCAAPAARTSCRLTSGIRRITFICGRGI